MALDLSDKCFWSELENQGLFLTDCRKKTISFRRIQSMPVSRKTDSSLLQF